MDNIMSLRKSEHQRQAEHEAAVNEIKYQMAATALKSMRDQGILSLEEHSIAERFIMRKYQTGFVIFTK